MTAFTYRQAAKAAAKSAAIAATFGACFTSSAHAQSRYLDPARIDRAIAQFTGKQVGEIGGARYLADKRLKLADCAQPLNAAWHGNGKSNVKVTCTGPSGWQVFVAINPAPKAAAPLPAAPIIKRGDAVAILVEGQGFTIRRTATAQQSGALGDWITVQPERRGKTVTAQIVRPGLVSIQF